MSQAHVEQTAYEAHEAQRLNLSKTDPATEAVRASLIERKNVELGAAMGKSWAAPKVESTQELWQKAVTGVKLDSLDLLGLEAAAELRRGDSFHGEGFKWPGNSAPHEAYGVLLEEMDELWDEVKLKRFNRVDARKEALHVAAMALRFIRNVCDVPDVVAASSIQPPAPVA